jgi:NADH-quinone oxidoreductase subunit H
LGPLGPFIIVADVVRPLSKELILPKRVDRPAYDLAPLLVTFSAPFGFAVILTGSGIQVADPATGKGMLILSFANLVLTAVLVGPLV